MTLLYIVSVYKCSVILFHFSAGVSIHHCEWCIIPAFIRVTAVESTTTPDYICIPVGSRDMYVHACCMILASRAIMVSLYVSVGLLVQLTLLTDRLRANPTGAPLAACSTLVPAHQAVSPTPCGDKCPYKMSVISGNLPRPFMYRCGDEYTCTLLSQNQYMQ